MRAVASAKQEVETTDPRELEFERRTDPAPAEEERVEEEAIEEEPEVEEVEPLVTSQS
jgi:hypothetical protein